MSIIMQINPFDLFTDTSGDPLDAGYIYIGEPNKDPRQYPVAAFYDNALTIPAPMPLRTTSGYIVRNGSPTFLYINGNYSVLVQNKKRQQIFYIADFLMIGSDSAVAAGDLANAVDPLKGAGLVGYRGRTVHIKLDESLNPKDGPYGAKGDGVTDDTAAITAFIATGLNINFPPGNYLISAPLALQKGQKITGSGGGRFTNSTSRTTTITCAAPTIQAFTQTASTSGLQEDGASFDGLIIVSDNPITLNDPTVFIADGGANPPLMRSQIKNVTFTPITDGAGVGLSMSKCFDYVVTDCEFGSHGTQLLIQGCDLGEVTTNRFTNLRDYGILELGVSTFGSQNNIHHNDMVRGVARTEFIRSTGRHVRIIDNYMEQSSGTCAAFIRLSATGIPTYGTNVVSTTRFSSVVVERNRIDGQANATGAVYVYEPVGVQCKIHDVGTTGPLSTLPWLLIEGNFLPIFRNTVNGCFYDFFGGHQNSSTWSTFKTKSVSQEAGGFGFDAMSLLDLNNSELRRNATWMNVRLDERSIILQVAMVGNFHCVLPPIRGVLNSWMKDGVNYNVTVVAKARNAGSGLRIIRVVNAAGVGANIDVALGAQPQTIKFVMAGAPATSTVGLAFSQNVPTDDIEIRSVFFQEV